MPLGYPEGRIDDEGWTCHVCGRGRDCESCTVLEMVARAGARAQRWPTATRAAENRTKQRRLDGVVRLIPIASRDPELRGSRVIDFGVDLVQVVESCLVDKVVVDVAWQIRSRNKRDHLLNNRVDPIGWNLVVREGCSSSTGQRVPRSGIVDRDVRITHVAGKHCRRGN